MTTSGSIETSMFRPEAVSEETTQFNAELARRLAAVPAMSTLPPKLVRQQRREGKGLFGPIEYVEGIETRMVPGPENEVPLRIFPPEGAATGGYLYLHGGGWVLGGADQQDAMLATCVRRTGIAVVSVEYRLAPEHPYPAGPDDCEAAAIWLVANAQAEFGSERLVIGGASAGGHLSAVTLLRMRDRHGYTGFCGANLTYGIYDLTETPSWGQAPQEYMVPLPTMRWFCDHFVAAERRRDADVSPLQANLRGMPPALFTVGTLDPLLDDTLFMSQRWLAAGNEGELALYPGGVHGFNSLRELATAGKANRRIDTFLAEAVAR